MCYCDSITSGAKQQSTERANIRSGVSFGLAKPEFVYSFHIIVGKPTLKLPRHRLQQIQRLDHAIPPEAHLVEHKLFYCD